MYLQKRGWGSAKSSHYNGYVYDSGFEAKYAAELDIQQKAGEIESWERQKTLELIVNGFLVCTYKIDFIVHHRASQGEIEGITEYVELKGFADKSWRIKWKLFEALYSEKPNTKLTVIWQGKPKRIQARKVK